MHRAERTNTGSLHDTGAWCSQANDTADENGRYLMIGQKGWELGWDRIMNIQRGPGHQGIGVQIGDATNSCHTSILEHGPLDISKLGSAARC